jgi:hypothetical protein
MNSDLARMAQKLHHLFSDVDLRVTKKLTITLHMSRNEPKEAGDMLYKVESILSENPSRRRRHVGPVAIVVTAILLASSLAYAAPAGGNGNNEHKAFKVLDKNGKLVGYSVTENMVAREVDSLWVTFFVHPAAGVFDSGAIYVYYMTPDCTGTTYITHYSTFSEGTRVGSKMYYPKDYQQLTPRSLRVVSAAGEDGACYAAPDVPGVYGLAATVDVSSFGLELPFKAQQ